VYNGSAVLHPVTTTLPFTVNAPVPVASSLDPSDAIAGGPALDVIVNGSNFVETSIVRVNGTARSTSFVSGSQLHATFPVTDLSSVELFTVTVFNPSPGGGESGGLPFIVNAPPVPVPPIPAASIPVTTPVGTVNVTFSDVTSGGTLTVTLRKAPPVPNPAPPGFKFGNLFFDVQTSATFTGPVTLCFPYNPNNLAAYGVTSESQLSLLHFDGTSWVDVTVFRDLTQHQICGLVTSLSRFAIAGFGGLIPEAVDRQVFIPAANVKAGLNSPG
jgi:hypothetical protein